jgi:Holliday junction DNA helicase RuvA
VIGRLTGTVLECSPDRVLLDVAGVGYAVAVPLSTFYTLCNRERARPVSLHVHTHVREDTLQLFGFAGQDEREMFEHLIAISGVGPRLALAILSGIGPQELTSAVLERDRVRLCRIPGVGRKTAERVLLELGDKLGGPSEEGAPGEAGVPAAGGADGPAGLRPDAVSALLNLGYARKAASRAVDAALENLDGEVRLETLLRTALARIVG